MQTHRDPAKVLGSASSLYLTFDHAVSEHADAHRVGREQFDQWSWGLNRALEVREHLPEDRVIDVQFADIVADPMQVVRDIHDKFGIHYDTDAERAVGAFLAENTRDKHGLHVYSLDDFGLDRDRVDAAFADYRERFGVAREA